MLFYAAKRNLLKTKRVLEANDEKKAAEAPAVQQFEIMSMPPIEPVLTRSPFVDLRSCVDFYSVIRYGPIHNFSLRISRLLKDICGTC